MKKNILIYIVVICTFAGIHSCDDTRLDNITPPSLYIPQSGEIEQIIYRTGEPFVLRLGIYKSGVEEVSATATVSIMSEVSLEAYNTEYGVNYKRLPDHCFSFNEENNVQVFFSKESRLEYVEIGILYEEIELLSDYDLENTANYVIPVILSQADIAIGVDKQVSLINVLVREPVVFFNTTVSSLQIESTDIQYAQTINIAVDFTNIWDISAELIVDEDALDEYNAMNNTELKLLPSNAYTMTSNPIIIYSGSNSATITITLINDNVDYDDFLLPITITNVSEFTIDPERKTHYLSVSRPSLLLDRTGWTIADFSSEEAVGEGDGQGVAACVLDDDATTYWHSEWAYATGELPHHITIDMQKEVTVSGADLQRRENNNDTYRGNFYVSSDNLTFTHVGTFEMDEINDPQTFRTSTARGRYFKVEITESRRTPYANMAEIYVRGVED